MVKEQYWSVIRFFLLDGKTRDEIKVKLYEPLFIKTMHLQWPISDIDSMDSNVTEHSFSMKVTTVDTIDKMYDDIVSADHRMKIREIVDTVNISSERVQNILYEKLGTRKPLVRWVSRLLTVEQKWNHTATS